MKILFYINVLSGGGAERVISTLANFFIQKKYDVVVVNTFPMCNEYSLNENVRHLYLENDNFNKNLLKRNIYRIKKLRKILKEEKPDVAIAFMTEANFRLIVSSLFLHIKTLVSVRNDPVTENKRLVSRLINNFTLKIADAVVFQTNDAQNYFNETITKHSRIIMNPIKNSIYDITYSDRPKDIVTAGRLSPQKNHLMLIDAFSRIAEFTDENLLIYGAGDYHDILINKIKELKMDNRIFLKGNSSKLHEDIKSAKLFVLSSDYEGLPNALMEAMALGLPCISTDCQGGGARMLIDDGVNGFLVPTGNAQLLADKIKYVLSLSEDERGLISKNARNTAQAFKADVVCEEWEDYIISLHNKNKVGEDYENKIHIENTLS